MAGSGHVEVALSMALGVAGALAVVLIFLFRQSLWWKILIVLGMFLIVSGLTLYLVTGSHGIQYVGVGLCSLLIPGRQYLWYRWAKLKAASKLRSEACKYDSLWQDILRTQ